MFKVHVIKVSTFHSDKKNKDFSVAWISTGEGLPCKIFVPDWVKADSDIFLKVVPDYNCNASLEVCKA